MRLKDRVALVTGGQRGIGKAIVLRLAQEGCHVAINYPSGDETARQAAEELSAVVAAQGRRALPVAADVTVAAEVRAMVEQVQKELGPIDILVNNAGIAPFSRFLDLSEEVFDRTMQVNVKGVFLCSQEVARHMVRRRFGKIINIASTSSLVALPHLGHYCASKAAVKMLTHAMALDLGRYNINVNAVGPSTTPTDLNAEYLSDPEILRLETEANPMKRLGTPEDVAAAVAFLASEDARQINGHLLMVDGGLTVRTPQPDLD